MAVRAAEGHSSGTRACLERLLAAGYAPGIQYAHVSADAVHCLRGVGQADLLEDVAISDRTTFNGYSVTKTFTAAAILQLATQGRLSLDAPIVDYIAEWPHEACPTARQLLTHTGGLPNPNPLSWCHLDSEHATFDAGAFIAGVLRSQSRPRERPGTAYRYSNLGYLLLGQLIERISGVRYTEFVTDQLIRPLSLAGGESLAFGIEDATVHAHGCVPRRSLINLVLGCFVDRRRYVQGRHGPWLQLRHLHVNGPPYGGLTGNCRGFARYLQALLGARGYVSDASRAGLFTRVSSPATSATPRSLGWFAGTLKGESYFAHAGGGPGYYCELRVYPALGRGSVVMTNRTGLRDARLLDTLDSTLAQRPA